MVAPHAWRTGAGRSFVNLLATAPRDLVDPVVAYLRPGPLHEEAVAMGLETHLVERGRRLRNLRGSSRALRELLVLARAVRPDLLYAAEPMGHLFTGPVAARLGLPAVWRQPGWASVRSPFDLSATLLPADAVIAASKEVAERQRRLPGSPPVHLIRPGIEMPGPPATPSAVLRERHGIPADAPLVGIVGRLEGWKGQDVFLRAAAALARERPDVRFAVVGGVEAGETTTFADGLAPLTRELGVTDRVTFTGSTTDVNSWMHAFDVAVNTSAHEPFGLVVLEALAVGTPVVAFRIGGPAEIIDHSRTGLLVDARTPEGFAAAIGRLVDDPELRLRMGRAGVEDVRSRYARERFGREVSALLVEVAERRGRLPAAGA